MMPLLGPPEYYCFSWCQLNYFVTDEEFGQFQSALVVF